MVKMIKFSTQLIHCALSNCYWEDPVTQFNRWEEKNRDNVRIINTFFTTMDKTEIVVVTYEELKTQEPKQYLKWEDLEFDDEWKYQEVKLNGTKCTIKYKCGFDFLDNYYEIVKIYNQNKRKQLFKLYNNEKFFNNLHLERME